MTVVNPKPTASAPTESPSLSDPIDLTRLNPDATDGVEVYGFTPSEVSPELNEPLSPQKIGSEFFFMKERIAHIERELKIKPAYEGRFK